MALFALLAWAMGFGVQLALFFLPVIGVHTVFCLLKTLMVRSLHSSISIPSFRDDDDAEGVFSVFKCYIRTCCKV